MSKVKCQKSNSQMQMQMHLHFIGIGGIGVSALARYYLTKGHKVSGSDLSSSEITKSLKKLGAEIFIGKHEAGNITKKNRSGNLQSCCKKR